MALPTVSIVTDPPAVGVQAYQTEAPPALPAWAGSPVSLVAFTLVAVMVPVAPVRTWALAKASLAGAAPAAVSTQLSVTLPRRPL